MRELGVMMEDEFSGQTYGFKMQIFPFSIVKSNYVVAFSSGREDLYERFGARKSDIESFKVLNKLTDVKYPVMPGIEIIDGNVYAEVSSFSRPKVHKVVGPYVRDWRDTESMLKGHYSCTCEAGRNTRLRPSRFAW